jgi:hypothetical protein
MSESASSGKEEEKVSLKNLIRGVASSIAGALMKGKEKAGSKRLLREDREKERKKRKKRGKGDWNGRKRGERVVLLFLEGGSDLV